MVTYLSTATRAQAIALRQAGWALEAVANKIKTTVSTVSKLFEKAIDRGWRPQDNEPL